jgi:hypothetical protein
VVNFHSRKITPGGLFSYKKDLKKQLKIFPSSFCTKVSVSHPRGSFQPPPQKKASHFENQPLTPSGLSMCSAKQMIWCKHTHKYVPPLSKGPGVKKVRCEQCVPIKEGTLETKSENKQCEQVVQKKWNLDWLSIRLTLRRSLRLRGINLRAFFRGQYVIYRILKPYK